MEDDELKIIHRIVGAVKSFMSDEEYGPPDLETVQEVIEELIFLYKIFKTYNYFTKERIEQIIKDINEYQEDCKMVNRIDCDYYKREYTKEDFENLRRKIKLEMNYKGE